MLREELGNKYRIIGELQIIKNAVEDCYKVAGSKATCLITGESGIGKELFARLLHNLTPRKDRNMVMVNCGALPEHCLSASCSVTRRGRTPELTHKNLGCRGGAPEHDVPR